MRIKYGQTRYINVTELRGFIELNTIYKYLMARCDFTSVEETYKKLLGTTTLCFSVPYNTLEQAEKDCSKICDGETEMTIGVTLLDHSHYSNNYKIALTTPSRDEKYQERIILDISEKLLRDIFGIEVFIKSDKRFSVYTTERKYNQGTGSPETLYNLIGETDDANEVDELYKKAFKYEMSYFKSIGSKFESYYTRCTMFTTDNHKDDLHYWYDYGSHSRFIEIYFDSKESLTEYNELQKKKQAEYEANEVNDE